MCCLYLAVRWRRCCCLGFVGLHILLVPVLIVADWCVLIACVDLLCWVCGYVGFVVI